MRRSQRVGDFCNMMWGPTWLEIMIVDFDGFGYFSKSYAKENYVHIHGW